MKVLCEKCRKGKATVFLTLVEANGTVARHGYCEKCFPKIEAERWRAHDGGWNRSVKPPVKSQEITAQEYLRASRAARKNPDDKRKFNRVSKKLIQSPGALEKLAFEMLAMAWAQLQNGKDPLYPLIVFPLAVRGSIGPLRMPEYREWLEKIVIRCLELWRQGPDPSADFGPFSITLRLTLGALHQIDRERYQVFLEALQRDGENLRILERHWRAQVSNVG